MKGYQCQHCLTVFSPNHAARRPVNVLGPTTEWSRSPVTMTRLGCPACGHEDLTDIYTCEECQVNVAEKCDDLCKCCREREDEEELQWWLDNEEGPDMWRKVG